MEDNPHLPDDASLEVRWWGSCSCRHRNRLLDVHLEVKRVILLGIVAISNYGIYYCLCIFASQITVGEVAAFDVGNRVSDCSGTDRRSMPAAMFSPLFVGCKRCDFHPDFAGVHDYSSVSSKSTRNAAASLALRTSRFTTV